MPFKVSDPISRVRLRLLRCFCLGIFRDGFGRDLPREAVPARFPGEELFFALSSLFDCGDGLSPLVF